MALSPPAVNGKLILASAIINYSNARYAPHAHARSMGQNEVMVMARKGHFANSCCSKWWIKCGFIGKNVGELITVAGERDLHFFFYVHIISNCFRLKKYSLISRFDWLWERDRWETIWGTKFWTVGFYLPHSDRIREIVVGRSRIRWKLVNWRISTPNCVTNA